MVDLVRHQTCDGALEDSDAPLPVDILVLDFQCKPARYEATHVEEAQAAFVLLIPV
jgi:hypothetical protein